MNQDKKFPEVHLGHHWGPVIAPKINVHPAREVGGSGEGVEGVQEE